MRIPESEPEPVDSPSPDALEAAIEDWHRSCRRACAQDRACAERFAGVVDSLITWLAEHPHAARIYFGEAAAGGRSDLASRILAAKQRMTSAIVELIADCGCPGHRTRAEFVVGAARQLTREELRREPVDHARLAHKLTRLAPLLAEPACTARD